jgi:hypothetical protein
MTIAVLKRQKESATHAPSGCGPNAKAMNAAAAKNAIYHLMLSHPLAVICP